MFCSPGAAEQECRLVYFIVTLQSCGVIKVLLFVFHLMFSETITEQLDEMVRQQLDKIVGQR